MSPLLSLSAIAKTFDNGTKAIQRLDMDVADGEFGRASCRERV